MYYFLILEEAMETINGHSNVIVCGETGCGKTTQILLVSISCTRVWWGGVVYHSKKGGGDPI
jgi:HrpA-like RNA helicase